MLFNSYLFIFLYLPVVLIGFFQLGRHSHAYAAAWLALASLFFYGYWNPVYVGLLLGSISCNYIFGTSIAKANPHHDNHARKWLFILAITANLLLLGYYKYANFFVGSMNSIAGSQWSVGEIMLPLGISFFTFTQIAFLVDTYQGKVKEYNFTHYVLFVTYFPHLIAGPVLHHREMMLQFARAATYKFNPENISIGMTIFFIGLFKKVVLADGIGVYVDPVFSTPATLGFIEVWGGALCYTLQLYFDFSGYSDMAIGLSRMFGVILPLNFHSPYKAVNMIEFWRRWHMTLSRFLRDYLYIPLGGNRKGKARRYLNLIATMLLGGLWHGAGWTFIVWGCLHGIFLAINHAWQALRISMGQSPQKKLSCTMHALSVMLTFLVVVVAWVIFRADNMHTAIVMLKTMAGLNGFVLPDTWLPKLGMFGSWLASHGVPFGVANGLIGVEAIAWIMMLSMLVWFAPNTQQIMSVYRPVLDMPTGDVAKHFLWRPTRISVVLLWLLAFFAIGNIGKESAFLYFQF